MTIETMIQWIRHLESMRDGTAQMDRTLDERLADLLNDPESFARFNAWMKPATAEAQTADDPDTAVMTPEDALLMMATIEAQRGSSAASQARADVLLVKLLSGDVDEFWEAFYAAPPLSVATTILLQIGTDATFADLLEAME